MSRVALRARSPTRRGRRTRRSAGRASWWSWRLLSTTGAAVRRDCGRYQRERLVPLLVVSAARPCRKFTELAADSQVEPAYLGGFLPSAAVSLCVPTSQ